MRTGIPIALLCALTCTAQAPRRIEPIRVEKRVALVIGNSRYAAQPLQNPAGDAAAMTSSLRALGFDVISRENLNLREMARVIDDFAARVQTGDLAFFYYSGHGIQVQQENYLIPVDFQRSDEADIPYTAYAASRVRDRMEATGARLRIMVLDACRDNPYHTSRSAAGGLAPMRSLKAEGTLIAYATGENNTADDNPRDQNGLYTKYLLDALAAPGLNLRELFYRVQQDVYLASNGKQNPYVYNGVIGDFYFRAPAEAPNDPPIPSVAGTTWAVTDADGDHYDLKFEAGGGLRYINPGNDGKSDGTWEQHGNWLSLEINKFSQHQAKISGDHMEGKARNNDGKEWTWVAQKK